MREECQWQMAGIAGFDDEDEPVVNQGVCGKPSVDRVMVYEEDGEKRVIPVCADHYDTAMRREKFVQDFMQRLRDLRLRG